jgi:hypothetical protein
MFKNFYEVLQVKFKCIDHTEIHAVRLFEISNKLYQIRISVEGPTSIVSMEDPEGNIHPARPEEHNGHHGEHPEAEYTNQDTMETDKTSNENHGGKGITPKRSAPRGSSTLGKTKSMDIDTLSMKVHEVVSAFMDWRHPLRDLA